MIAHEYQAVSRNGVVYGTGRVVKIGESWWASLKTNYPTLALRAHYGDGLGDFPIRQRFRGDAAAHQLACDFAADLVARLIADWTRRWSETPEPDRYTVERSEGAYLEWMNPLLPKVSKNK